MELEVSLCAPVQPAAAKSVERNESKRNVDRMISDHTTGGW